jgi:hypothetical protein
MSQIALSGSRHLPPGNVFSPDFQLGFTNILFAYLIRESELSFSPTWRSKDGQIAGKDIPDGRVFPSRMTGKLPG